MVWTVRLVRACGSKPKTTPGYKVPDPGQARKSLWIETAMVLRPGFPRIGQARKSLWIETDVETRAKQIMPWSGS